MAKSQSKPGSSSEPAATGNISSRHWIVAGGLFALTQLFYTLTLFPTVTYGDNGSLITAAYTLGIPHPPGYPLYTLVANLFSHIPFGSVAWRINLASAVFGSGTAIFLYLTMVYLTRNLWASVLTVGMYVFSPLIWHHALLAEVFSLNNLFVALLAYLSVKYYIFREEKTLFLLAFATGLGLSHQHTLLFWAGPLWLWLTWADRKSILNSRVIRTCALLLILGLTPYLYLRVTAIREPRNVWGDLSSWVEVFRHIRRFQYGTLSLIPDAAGGTTDVFKSLWFYFRHLPSQVLFVGVPLALWGLYRGISRKVVGGFIGVTAGAFLLYVIVFHTLARFPIEENHPMVTHLKKFWVMPNLFVFIWIGYGFAKILSLGEMKRRIGYVAVIVLVGLQLALHYKTEDRSNHRFFHNDAALKLEHLPPGALLLTSEDTESHSLQYLQECEHIRDDVSAINMDLLTHYWAGPVVERNHQSIVFPGDILMPSAAPSKGQFMASVHGTDIGYRNAYSLSYLFDANIHDHPIYTTRFLRRTKFRGARSWSKDYALLPMGTLFKVIKKGEDVSLDAYLAESTNYLPDLQYLGQLALEKGSWEYFTWLQYWYDYQLQISTAVQIAGKPGATEQSLETLASLMENYEATCPLPLKGAFYWDLAIVYSYLLDSDPAMRDALRKLWNERLKSIPAPSFQHDRKIRNALQGG